MHLKNLREVADEVAKPLAIISEQLWQSSDILTKQKRRNITPTFKKRGKKTQKIQGTTGQLGSSQCLVRSWSRQILLEAVPKHMETEVTDDSQHGSIKCSRAQTIWNISNHCSQKLLLHSAALSIWIQLLVGTGSSFSQSAACGLPYFTSTSRTTQNFKCSNQLLTFSSTEHF